MTDGRRYEIGYALAPKKKNSFIQLSLVELAKKRGIDLICIDSDKPLIDQGPFDCILHKLSGEEWTKQLEEYQLKHPHVYIIDRPEAIERLHNRISMLQVVSELRIQEEKETFGIPKQIVVYKSEALRDLKTLVGLKFPVIAKPLVVDGSVKSHKMSLVFNSDGLLKLKPPLVLQEFVNHGGVIFKVYVVGDYVKCVKRKSLPDVPNEKLQISDGTMAFCQISNMTHDHNEKYYEVMHLEDAELPPTRFIAKIAKGLRRALGLHLFNFDVIRDTKAGNHYLVIDINYFPGYAKMPAYESVLTDFFWNIFHDKRTLDGSAIMNEKSGGARGEEVVDDSIDEGVSTVIVKENLLCEVEAMEASIAERKIDSSISSVTRKESFPEDNVDGIISPVAREEGFLENNADGIMPAVGSEERSAENNTDGIGSTLAMDEESAQIDSNSIISLTDREECLPHLP